jgi:hypothetical protein
MKVLIGVDPHRGSVAVAAVGDANGELLERASFPQERAAGLRALESWAKRFSERRWAVENAGGGLGRYLAGRLAASGESVVDVPPKLSARVRVLSSFAGNVRKNDGVDALATASPRTTRGWRRSIPSPNRRCCACFPKGAQRPGGRAYSGAQAPARASTGASAWRGSQRTLSADRGPHASCAARSAAKLLLAPPPSTGFSGVARGQDAGPEDR